MSVLLAAARSEAAEEDEVEVAGRMDDLVVLMLVDIVDDVVESMVE